MEETDDISEKRAIKAKVFNKTTLSQRGLIIQWLSIPENFNLINRKTGNGEKIPGTKKRKKIDGFQSIADYVNEKGGLSGDMLWDKDSAKSRYQAMFHLYKKTKALYEDTTSSKFHLTDKDVAKGLTIKDKVMHYCPGYFTLDDLFCSRQNNNPASVVTSAVKSGDNEIKNDAVDLNALRMNQERDEIEVHRKQFTCELDILKQDTSYKNAQIGIESKYKSDLIAIESKKVDIEAQKLQAEIQTNKVKMRTDAILELVKAGATDEMIERFLKYSNLPNL